MPSADERLNLQAAFSFHQAGQIDKAADLYRGIISREPNNLYALHYLGIIEAGRGRFDQAKSLMARSLAIGPPNLQFLENYASMLFQIGDHQAALQGAMQGLQLDRNNAALTYVSAISLFKLNRFQDALGQFDKLLVLQPSHLAAINERASVLASMKRTDEALAGIDRALAIQPRYAEAHFNKANLFSELKRLDEAVASYDQTLALKPDFAEAWFGRGNALTQLNDAAGAVASFEQALAIRPDYAEARFAACLAGLPILYAREEDIAPRREAYTRKLQALAADVEAGRVPGHLVKAVAARTPFYLAYQGQNDRDLQAVYGAMVCRIMGRAFPNAPMPAPPRQGEPVRVGVVSAFFHRHPVWNLFVKGWIGQLDRKRFRIFGYHSGDRRDAETGIAASMCERFVHAPLAVGGWRQEILRDAPHVLIYPGLYMDHMSTQLAAQRLAPVQCGSFGHPETSGMPTMDCYLSSALMEPPDGEGHYTERLVRLPNLGMFYEPIETQAVAISRGELGLRADAALFWCGQSLFKYLPQYDQVFPRIAKAAPHAQFAFIQSVDSPKITRQFQERLSRAFAALGLDAARHCVMLPRLSVERFVGAMALCDVFLDSIPWSGGNTTLESMTHDLPIVTLQGALLRGRTSAAMLQMMGIPETIATTVDEYVAIAARLANDAEGRVALRRWMATNKQRLYRDRTCITALENFLDAAARTSRP